MRAWLLEPPGGPESLRLVDLPGPRRRGAGRPVIEAVVRVEAVGLSSTDGVRDPRIPGPFVPGVDVAGRVLSVRPLPGESLPESAPAPGSRVACHLPALHGGGFAQRIAVPVDILARIPEQLDAVAAASLVTPGLTALDAVERRLRQLDGSRVLVTGADTPVGLWSVQLARLFGATVIATARRGNDAVVRAHGAMHVLDAEGPAAAPSIAAVAPGGLDDVIDTVSSASATAQIARLRLGGHLVALAGRPDVSAQDGTRLLPTVSQVSLAAIHEHGGARGSRWLRWGLERLMRLVWEGHVDPTPIELVDFAQIPAALSHLAAGEGPARYVVNLRWGRWASLHPQHDEGSSVRQS